MHRHITTLALGAVIALSPFAAFAQETPSAVSTSTASGSTTNGSALASCFDYYRFGSTPIVFQSDTTRVAQGGVLKLTGTITNQNAYPLDDVTVYGKVFYKKNFDKNSFGPDVVDWFPVAEHLNLKAGEVRQLTYSWQVPSNTLPGFYQVATYAAAHDRFNFAGLTFSNDVVGNLFNFSVAGQDQGSVRFDNTQTTLNGIGFHAAIFPPRSNAKTDGVPLTAVVSNTTGSASEGTIHWSLYSWDGINQQNLITQSDSSFSVGAHASTTVSYTVKDASHTVYYIIGEIVPAKGTMAKSLLTVRYVATDPGSLDMPRLADVGASAYPAVSGDTVAYACFHSTGSKPAGNVKVEVSVTPHDPLAWFLHFGSLGKNTYSGSAPGEISAVIVPFKAGSSDFSVTARLFQDGKLLDSVTSDYSCSTFAKSCSITGWVIMTIVGFIVLILLCGLLIARRRRANAMTSSYAMPNHS